MLLSLANYKALAGITSTDATRDAALTAALAAADAAIKKWCRTHFEQQTLTEYYDPPMSDLLVLRQLPVASVTSIVSDPNGHYGQGADAFAGASATTYTAGTDYALLLDQSGLSRTGTVRRIGRPWGYGGAAAGGSWPWAVAGGQPLGGGLVRRFGPTPGSLRVIYVSGFSAVPADVEAAASLLATHLYNRRKTGFPTTSESYNGYSAGYAVPAATVEATQLLGGDPVITQLLGGYRDNYPSLGRS